MASSMFFSKTADTDAAVLSMMLMHSASKANRECFFMYRNIPSPLVSFRRILFPQKRSFPFIGNHGKAAIILHHQTRCIEKGDNGAYNIDAVHFRIPVLRLQIQFANQLETGKFRQKRLRFLQAAAQALCYDI